MTVTVEHILSKLCPIFMFTTLVAVIFFSLKERRARKDVKYETLLSACYRWATAPKAGNGPRISVVEPKINPPHQPSFVIAKLFLTRYLFVVAL